MGRAGLPADRFWSMTPREVQEYLDFFGEQRRERQRVIIEQSWLTANLVWQKKMPTLEKLLADLDRPAPKKQTAATNEELIAAAKSKGLAGPW